MSFNLLEHLHDDIYGKIQEYLNKEDLINLLKTSNKLNRICVSEINGILREHDLIGKDRRYWTTFIKNGGCVHIECYKYLVEALGVTLDDIRNPDNKAITVAAKKGRLEIVQYLMSMGLNSKDLRYPLGLYYPIVKAAKNGHIKVFKYLVDFVELADIRKFSGKALMYLTIMGHLDTIKYLIDRGLNLNDIRGPSYLSTSSTCTWNYALYYASKYGKLEIVKFYVEKGLTLNDIKCGDNYIINAMALAGQVDVMQYFISIGLTLRDIRGTCNYTLLCASRSGNLEMVKYLVSLGIKLDDILSNDCILVDVAGYGYLEILQYLISLGITLDDLRGPTCTNIVLYGAIMCNKLEILKYLLGIGLNVGDINNIDHLVNLMLSEVDNTDTLVYLDSIGVDNVDRFLPRQF